MTSRRLREPLSRLIARAVNGMAFHDIPHAVTERASMLVLDAAGAALAAADRGHCRPLIESLTALSGGGAHPVIGIQGARLNARDAACANGMLMHSLEFDDTHMTAILHVTSAVFPAALATGAHTGASGRDVMAAYAAGAEVMARLGMAARGGYQRRGFHPTGVAGAFAAALTAGKLLGLSEDQMVHAQGIALSLASGSMQFLHDGGDMKRFHPGWAAQSGMTAAVMASKGMQGPAHCYEGRHGLFAAYLGQDTPDEFGLLVSTIGSHWELPNIAVKPFPAAYYTHACIECAIELSQYDGFDPAAIATVIARVPAEVADKIGAPLEQKRRPASFSEAQFALPYLVAAAFVRRTFTLTELEDGTRHDPEVLALAARTRCEGVADTRYPEFYPGGLEIVLQNGHTLKKSIEHNLGSVARPIGDDLIVEKFTSNAPRAHAVKSAILNLIHNGSIGDLYNILSS